MKTLTREEALHCANIFNDYFGQFSRIDQYMRDQKMAQIETIPAPLPGMGLDSDMFDDFDMSPEVMDCLLYTSPSPRDLSTSRMPSSA